MLFTKPTKQRNEAKNKIGLALAKKQAAMLLEKRENNK